MGRVRVTSTASWQHKVLHDGLQRIRVYSPTMLALIAILVFVVVALGAFAIFSLIPTRTC
jgi:hypothetical protein